MEEGKRFGLKLAGAYAMDSLRLEKGYRHWGHELDCETSPLEARLMHAVDLNKVCICEIPKLRAQRTSGT